MVDDGQVLKLPEHQPALTQEQEQIAGRFVSELERDPYSPTTDFAIEGEVLNALIDQGRVVKVSTSVVFASGAYQDMLGKITAHLNDNGSITVAEARTMFNSSRKYVLPLLEYLDQQRITRRVGDERVLR